MFIKEGGFMDLTTCIKTNILKNTIIKEIKNKIATAKVIKYGNPSIDPSTKDYMLDAKDVVIVDEKDKKESKATKGFVYLLLDDSNNCLYVGSSRNIKSRLDSHLIKNNKIKKDGTPRKSITGSEIDNVFDHVVKSKSIKYCYAKIEPWYLYTAVENQLIDYFRKKNEKDGVASIWNAGYKDDDSMNETPGAK